MFAHARIDMTNRGVTLGRRQVGLCRRQVGGAPDIALCE